MDDATRINLLPPGMLQQAAMAKALRAKQLESMMQAQEQPAPAQAPPQGTMSQSQFGSGVTPPRRNEMERARQQQALILKLRSLGQ